MKISRHKKAQKFLTYYSNHFGFHTPYQILIDATFCYAALQNKVEIVEQLEKYFQSQIKFVTTQCIILEAEGLGPRLTGATLIVKKFYVHKCGHEGKPVSGSACVTSMVKGARYIVATQDRNIQEILRKRPGQPILYLHKCTPVLEPPSDVTKKFIAKKLQKLVNVQDDEKHKIEGLKKLQGIESKQPFNEKKKKKTKNPNPLSCKKKKPKDASMSKKKKRPKKRGGKGKTVEN